MDIQDSGWNWTSAFGIALAVLAIVGLGWGVAVLLPNSVKLNADFDALQFLEHLAILAILATAIERATQSMLFLTKTDGTDRAIVEATGVKAKDGSRAAMMISLPLGLAVGLTGIGVITPLISIEPSEIDSTMEIARMVVTNLQNKANQLALQITTEEVAQEIGRISAENVELSRSILRGVDTIVTGGLLAGGASGIHQVAEVVKSLVRGPDRARADVLAGTSSASVLSLERGSTNTQLWHLDRAFKIEGSDDGLQEGTYHRVALRGTTKENMFIEFPLTTGTGRVPKITATDLAGGGLSMAREDLNVLTDRLGNIPRDDLKIVVRQV
ncbi:MULTISPECIES: hypothetical protein [Vibrio]|uniref:Uncharacterized protein n=1 Tax=Vibrio mytili TaxID=50718 RepID=A0A0C3I6D3_9VIBR|nr:MULTISPECIES: hypothetical protein [Vibrio]KIN09907.1 hypothetical protein SU60_16300 [Vibrio mytili]MDW2063114.1 hypothetical protein [Vibrio sp. 1579]